jgi:hypothetical protein
LKSFYQLNLRIIVPGSLSSAELAVPLTSWNHPNDAAGRSYSQTKNARDELFSSVFISFVISCLQEIVRGFHVDKTALHETV